MAVSIIDLADIVVRLPARILIFNQLSSGDTFRLAGGPSASRRAYILDCNAGHSIAAGEDAAPVCEHIWLSMNIVREVRGEVLAVLPKPLCVHEEGRVSETDYVPEEQAASAVTACS